MTASWALHYCEWSESRSVLSNSLQPQGLYSPWNSPGQNTGVGSLALLQGIFPIQGSNPGLLHCRQILYQLSHKGSPKGSNISTPLKLSSQRLPVISFPLSKSKVFSFCWCPSVFDTSQCFMFPEILSWVPCFPLFHWPHSTSNHSSLCGPDFFFLLFCKKAGFSKNQSWHFPLEFSLTVNPPYDLTSYMQIFIATGFPPPHTASVELCCWVSKFKVSIPVPIPITLLKQVETSPLGSVPSNACHWVSDPAFAVGAFLSS